MNRRLLLHLLVTAILLAPAELAQTWEAGAAIGFGFYHDASLTGPTTSGRAGFGDRFVLSAMFGHSLGQRFSIEGRYTFQDGDPEIVSGTSRANLDGDSSSLLAEIVFSPFRRHAWIRPYLAAGGGMKIYRGSGTPAAVEPLMDLAVLHSATDAVGLFTYGGGVKFRLSRHLWLRLDLRDYTTPFPTRVITPAPGVKVGGWLHDFVPTLGLSWGR